jgi:hypothetical protein
MSSRSNFQASSAHLGIQQHGSSSEEQSYNSLRRNYEKEMQRIQNLIIHHDERSKDPQVPQKMRDEATQYKRDFERTLDRLTESYMDIPNPPKHRLEREIQRIESLIIYHDKTSKDPQVPQKTRDDAAQYKRDSERILHEMKKLYMQEYGAEYQK